MYNRKTKTIYERGRTFMSTENGSEPRAKLIPWYRTPIDPATMKQLYTRSDAMGLAQSAGYLGLLIITAGAVLYSWKHWPWWATVLLLFLHGTCFAFQINAVHEIGHETVFKSKWLTKLFVHIFAFLGYVNHYMFEASHVRHHRSTLHPPDDLEVVVPITYTLKDFLKFGIINFGGPLFVIKHHWRIACGRFMGEWELKCFPESSPEKRRPAILWSRAILAGHAAIIVVSCCFKLWMLPVVWSLAPFYGGWLLFLCNNTQHVGLADNSTDFRLCCRTFIPNPIVRFLYWHMNYHTEHHMYVGVPCYNLGKLHAAVKHDMPPVAHSIYGVWQEISWILKKQKEDPTYIYHPPLPGEAVEAAAKPATAVGAGAS